MQKYTIISECDCEYSLHHYYILVTIYNILLKKTIYTGHTNSLPYRLIKKEVKYFLSFKHNLHEVTIKTTSLVIVYIILLMFVKKVY